MSHVPKPSAPRGGKPPASIETPGGVWALGRWRVPEVVRRFPRVVSTPALVPVGRSDLRAKTVMRLRPLSTPEALRRVREDRAHLEAELSALRSDADPRAMELRQEGESTERLESDLVGRRTRLWEVLLGFSEGSPGLGGATRAMGRLKGDLLERGFRFHSGRWRAPELERSLEPGGSAAAELFHVLPEEGVASLLPLWEDRWAESRGALLGVHARHGTPVFVDRFQHPSHSSAIFGQTGSGKTYASALGWIRLRWFRPDLSVFVLDPLGGLAHVVRALGGKVLRVGATGAAGESINPLDPSTTGGDRRAKASQVGVMFRALCPSLTDEEAAILDLTVSRLYEAPGGSVPRLSDLIRALSEVPRPPERLLALLAPGVAGSLRSLDQPTTIDLGHQLLGFDLSSVTAGELPFFLTLLLDLVYGELRRRSGPKLVVLDEAHYLARAPATAAFLDHLVRHVRHFGAGLELLSQVPEDFLLDPSGRSVLMNLDSVLVLRLRDGGASMSSLLELQDGELSFLRQAALPRESGYSEGLWRTGSVHLPLAILASPEEDRLLREAFDQERAAGSGASPPAPRPAA